MLRLIRKFLIFIFDTPLPLASGKEKELVEDVRKAFINYDILKVDGCTESEAFWQKSMNRLRWLVIQGDPREFLRWDVVQQTMFVGSAAYISTELKYLKRHLKWEGRWKPAIQESPVGHPPPYFRYSKSSGNLIHHTYHVSRFEDHSQSKIENMSHIFEFGGGYGSMCRLINQLGFKGRYIIFDLPPFSNLQTFYLRCLDIPVHKIEDYDTVENGVFCISTTEDLTFFEKQEMKNSLFIATWSLSESPLHVRKMIEPLSDKYDAFLIAYQEDFGEVNNIEYFTRWIKEKNNVSWGKFRISHAPRSWYLFGTKNL